MANPLLAGEMGGYDDFLKEYGTKPGVQKSSKETEHELNDKEIQEQVKRAERMLKNCTPKGKAVR